MATTTKADARAESTNALRGMFPEGSTVHVIIRHVSASGMTRVIAVLHVSAAGDIHDVSGHVAKAVGKLYDSRRGGVLVRGGGMDMGFHLVYSLAVALYGDGYALHHRQV